jgi:hypothetical protein
MTPLGFPMNFQSAIPNPNVYSIPGAPMTTTFPINFQNSIPTTTIPIQSTNIDSNGLSSSSGNHS